MVEAVLVKLELKELIEEKETELFLRRAFANSFEDVIENMKLEDEIKMLKRIYNELE